MRRAFRNSSDRRLRGESYASSLYEAIVPAILERVAASAALATEVATAVATAGLWPTMGLLERIPIFGFVQWAAVSSIVLARWQPVSRTAAGVDSVRL